MVVNASATFSFKIFGGNAFTRLETDSLVLEVTDDAGGTPKTVYLKINYNPQSSIYSAYNQTQLSNVAINVLPGSLSFSLKKAGSVSASLYSLAGQKVSTLLDNQHVAENGTHAVRSFYALSNGLYLLKCQVVNAEGVTNIERRITFIKN